MQYEYIVDNLEFIYGANIKYFRVKKNLRQTDLALLTGVTKTTISNIELGLVWAGRDSLKAIMNVLEMKPSDLTSQVYLEAEELEVAEDTNKMVRLKRVGKAPSDINGDRH